MKKNTNLPCFLVIALFFVISTTTNVQFLIGVKGEVWEDVFNRDKGLWSFTAAIYF